MTGSASEDRQLTVVIPSYGDHGGLAAVLDGLGRQGAERFEAMVVVDEADPDRAAGRAAGDRPYPLRVLRGGAPGASASRNAGWAAATTPLILFIDDDTVPTAGLVREHRCWHRRHPDEMLAVLGLVRWAPSVKVTAFMRWLDHGIQFDYPRIRGIDAGWGRFYSANVSVKRTMLERLGGFDEQRFPYGYEDLELAYRARPLGLRVFLNREAVVEHLRAYDLELFKRRVQRIAVAEREFTRRHPEVRPYFFELFSSALQRPPARGRGRLLSGRLPRSLPLVGERAWASADLYYRQQLAPYFLAAWAERRPGGSPPPERSPPTYRRR